MADIFDKKTRSRVMSRIRSRNTAPEIIFRKLLHAHGLRYRLNRKIIGNPDIVLPSRKVAIFIDGCFWHKCPKCFQPPSTNKRYWEPKLAGNVIRDKKTNKELKSKGWTVIRIWEHQIMKNPAATAMRVTAKIKKIPKS